MRYNELLNLDLEVGVVEKIENIIDGILANHIPKSRFFEVKNQLDEYKEKLESINIEEKEQAIKDLKNQISIQEKAHKEQLKKVKLENAIEKELTSNKVRNSKAVLALLDEVGELDENGNVKGLQEQLDKLKESDSYLFDIQEQAQNQPPQIAGLKLQDGNQVTTTFDKTAIVDTANVSYEQYANQWSKGE